MKTVTEAPSATLLTADDLLRLDTQGVRGELIQGVFCEMSKPSWRHGQLALRLGAQLLSHVDARKLGTVASEIGVLLERDPDTVRAPDVAYISYSRLPKGRALDRYDESVPELVVEVVSPSDRLAAVREKARMWLSFGVQLVWVVFPDARTVEAYSAGLDTAETLTEADSLDGGSVLPGFTYPLSHLFAD